MKIAIIGAGNLGNSIAQGILKYNPSTIEKLILTKKHTITQSQLINDNKVEYSNDNIAAVKQSKIVIIAVQPQQLGELCSEIKEYLTSEKLLISTISNKPIAKLESMFGEHISIIRCMPNIAIAVGESMTCMSSNRKGSENIEIAEQIFSSLGETMQIDDEMMRAATVICGSGIAFWMRLIRATTQAAIQLGFDANVAAKLSIQSSLGSAKLLSLTSNHPEYMIDKVTTPKGCTISGLNEMEHQGMSSALIKGLLKSYEQISSLNGKD